MTQTLPPKGLAKGHDRGHARGSEREHGVRQYLTIILDQRSYGIPLAQVAEISPNRELRRMPHMPPAIEGLLDFRGKVIPVMNLRYRLGLPEQERSRFLNILILNTSSGQLGVLVDKVDSVVTAGPEEHAGASNLLAGMNGFWVTGFLVRNEKITVLLDVEMLDLERREHAVRHGALEKTVEHHLDESLQHLIEMAPAKSNVEKARIIPQIQEAIAHTEEEMTKVLDRVELMLNQADGCFKAVARLKQEFALGKLKGQDKIIAELERNNQKLQDEIFDLMGKIQFQDIARQKLERVLMHIHGLQIVLGDRLRDRQS